jgi:hypothetical protein
MPSALHIALKHTPLTVLFGSVDRSRLDTAAPKAHTTVHNTHSKKHSLHKACSNKMTDAQGAVLVHSLC